MSYIKSTVIEYCYISMPCLFIRQISRVTNLSRFCATINQFLCLISPSVVVVALELYLKRLRKTGALKNLQPNHSHKRFG